MGIRLAGMGLAFSLGGSFPDWLVLTLFQNNRRGRTCTQIAPHMHQIFAPLSLLFLSSALYAVALSTPLGRKWTERKTWTTVVVGDALILVFYALYDAPAALDAFWFFAAAGVPIIVREVVLEFHREVRIEQRAREE